MTLRGELRDTPSISITRAVTTGHPCGWHRYTGSYSRQSGETARREQGSKPKREYDLQDTPGDVQSETNWGRDISELFRRESEAAPKTAEAMIVQVASGASCIRTRAPYRNNYIAAAVKC